MIAVPAVAALATLAAVAPARTASTMTLSLSPPKPLVDSEATLTIRGTADQTAAPVVAAISGSSCPTRFPQGAYATQSEDRSVVLGTFTRKVSVNVEVRTRWFCAYLLPAEEVDGGVQFNTFAAPLARAGVHLAEQLAGALAGEPYAGVSGGTRSGDNGVSLSFDRSATRIVKVLVTCGGDARKPPSIGREFIGKRFTAKVSFPLTRTINWSGLIKPDNSNSYDPPPPAVWTRPTRYSLNAKLTFRQGQLVGLVGTGLLTSPGLPCPKLRRYVARP